MFKEYPFKTRLALLLACDIAISLLDTFIPHELWPVRALVAIIQFGFMALTMAITLRRIVEDY